MSQGYEDPQKQQEAQPSYYAPQPQYQPYPPPPQQQPAYYPPPQQQVQYAAVYQPQQVHYGAPGVVPLATTTTVNYDAPVNRSLVTASGVVAVLAGIACIVALTTPFVKLTNPTSGFSSMPSIQISLFKITTTFLGQSSTSDSTSTPCDGLSTVVKAGRAGVIVAMVFMFGYFLLAVARYSAHRNACIGFCLVIPWNMALGAAAVCEILVAVSTNSNSNGYGSGSGGSGSGNSNGIFTGSGCLWLQLYNANLLFGFFALQAAGACGTAAFIMECCYCCTRRNVTTTQVAYVQQPLVQSAQPGPQGNSPYLAFN